MTFFSLKPAAPKPLLPDDQIDSSYRWLREQVFLGTFIGYAGYYLLRKNFSLAMPYLVEQGYSKTQLGIAFSAVALSYGISKFLMGNVSDRSDARKFLTLGLLLTAGVSFLFGCFSVATSSVAIMYVILFIGGWFQGMGWAPCGRSMVHWFTARERGFRMAIWNVAHNVGGGLIGPLAVLGLFLFSNDWRSVFYFPAIVACGVAGITFFLMRDTPQSCGLPPIEKYKNEYPENYNESFEKEMTSREIFFLYVFNNKLLWFVALANAFIYLIRYGIIDWAPTYLTEVKGYSINKASWAYFAYEYSGIPGTILCGWMSDRFFKGHRAPATILFLIFVAIAIAVYWLHPPGNIWLVNISLISIGFLIYGPVMMTGLHALELVPKKAAGTAAGLTGLFGYLFGAMSANIVIGWIVDCFGWNGSFILLLTSCFAAMFFIALTWKKEKRNFNLS
ncbi:MAG: glycerol-3-phosphate transporter [Planctomycetaceae bacterium]|jgi:OPA family glycerol-3-phosphate transporter-like MFS transporter|nr:glycerol-3-phosphate transporter [Planctomycetaceae bacterium]